MPLLPGVTLCKLHIPLYEYEGTEDHCYAEPVQAAAARRLQSYRRQLKRLAEQLAAADWISSGSVSSYSSTCGKPTCHCHSDPSHLHGPYWQWTSKKNGKTVARSLSPGLAGLYQEWIANRRRLLTILSQMEELSHAAAPLLLESDPEPSPLLPVKPTRRLTRQLLDGLVQLPELIEPVAEAAQEVLEAREEADSEAISQARQRLFAVLDDSAELTAATHRLLVLVRPPDVVGPS
jgi:hypothetical protein